MEKEKIPWPKRLKVPGKRLNAQLVPLERTKGKPLYVDKLGRGYSCHVSKNAETGEYVFMPNCIKDGKNGEYRNILCHTGKEYRNFRNFNYNILVHHAVLLAWVGPRPEGYECDHLNGDNTDNRLWNLQWVTHLENVRRGIVLKQLRKLHNDHPDRYKDPAKMSRQELLDRFGDLLNLP